MAYTKLQKGVQDFGLGFQSINNLIAGIDQMRADYLVKHSPLAAQSQAGTGAINSGAPWLSPGRHNDLFIPRGSLHITVSSWTPMSGGAVQATTTLDLGSFGIAQVSRLTEGLYLVATPFLSADAYAEVGCEASTAADVRRGYARNWSGIVTSSSPGFFVALFALGAGAFSPADFSFSLHLHDVQ